MKHIAHLSVRLTAFLLCLLVFGEQLTLASPRQTPSSPNTAAVAISLAPAPALLQSAHTVFLSNSGAQTGFPADPDAGYNQFYADLQAWGRFQLVSSPSEADLIFQLRSAAPIDGYSVNMGVGTPYRLPQFLLTIVDPKTNVTLWTLSSPVYTGQRKHSLTDWFTLSAENLTSRVKLLVGTPLNPQEVASLNDVPPNHAARKALILTAVFAGAAVAGAFILHHEYEVHKNDQPTVPALP